MARMYPANVEKAFPRNTGGWGEALVFTELEKLPADWVVICDLWRYYMDGRDEHVNYELDFIVLVPGRGYVVIEVKNWHRVEVRDGCWWFLGRNGRMVSMDRKTSPLHQAYLGSKKLNSELCRVRRMAHWYTDAAHPYGKVEYHALAVLLNQLPENVLPIVSEVESDVKEARRTGSVPLEELYICGEQELRLHLQEKIERTFIARELAAERGFIPLTHEQIDQIVNYLLPSFHLKSDPNAYNRIMEDAIAPIRRLLPVLEESTGGISVSGCAGSGKTWMAVLEIARLTRREPSRRFLFLCFNLALAEHLRRLPELADTVASGQLTVTTFPALCREITGADFGNDWEAQLNWFRSLHTCDTPQMLTDLCSAITERHRYDYLFIDECQDFPAEWEPVIEALRAPGARLYVFSDDNQNLFVNKGRRPYQPDIPTRVRLVRNLRNSGDIARFSSAMLDAAHRMVPLEVPGLKVVVQPAVENPQERARTVSFWINRLIHGKRDEERRNVPEPLQNNWLSALPHQIVVLSPYAPHKRDGRVSAECTLPLVQAVTCRSAELSAEELLLRWETDENIVMGTTIRSFKGLEADYVILTDVDSPDGDDMALNKNDFYVACTRARYGLIIIPRTLSGEQYARALQAAAEQRELNPA